MAQVELNKAVINGYFEAYNNKNEAIFNEIIAPDYIDHGQIAYMGSPSSWGKRPCMSMHENIKGSQLVSIEKARHGFYFEERERINSELIKFIG